MPEIKKENKVICYHCGDICHNTKIAIDDKYFCCQGCKFVYELLSENNLNGYYSIEDNPGVIPPPDKTGRFKYLDNPVVANKLYDYSDDQTARITFFIPKIHCSSCIWLLENLNKLNSGILVSRVNFLEKEVSITFNPNTLSLSDLVGLLSSIGYEPDINLGDLDKPANFKSRSKDHLYAQIAVAGFCFVNIMLFSFPEYFSSPQEIGEEYRSLFGYLKIILSLPVLFFSAYEYLKSAYLGLKQKFVNMDVPISLGIIILFSRSVYEIISGTGIGYMDSFTGFIFFLLLGKLFQKKIYKSISFERDYKSYFPVSVAKHENDKDYYVPISELKPGDHITIRNNEIVPADSIILKQPGTFDFSFVTGESTPVVKQPAELVYAGGRVRSGSVEMEIIKEVNQSYLIELWNNPIFKKTESSNINNLANNISKYFIAAVLSLALVAGIRWWLIDPQAAVNVVTSILIIACPCALALSTPFTLGTASRILGRNGFFLKNIDIVESLAKIDRIIFDKTGTLTQSQKSEVKFHGSELSDEYKRMISLITRQSSHPLSRRIGDLYESDQSLVISDFVEKTGYGIEAIIDNHKIRMGSIEWVENNHGHKNRLENDKQSTRVYLSVDNTYTGYYEFQNSYRLNLQSVIKSLKKKYDLSMLSGDNESERNRIQPMFGDNSELIFNCSPYQKLEYVENQRKAGERVLMVGDGLNDAGALKQSNIGISISEDIMSFSPASDGVLISDSFDSFDKFLKLSTKCLGIIKISFALSFLYNIVGLSFAVMGKLSPVISAVLMPLSSISVVLFATITTLIVGKRLGLNQ